MVCIWMEVQMRVGYDKFMFWIVDERKYQNLKRGTNFSKQF